MIIYKYQHKYIDWQTEGQSHNLWPGISYNRKICHQYYTVPLQTLHVTFHTFISQHVWVWVVLLGDIFSLIDPPKSTCRLVSRHACRCWCHHSPFEEQGFISSAIYYILYKGVLFGHMSVFGVLNVFVGATDFDEMVKTLREYELSIKEGHVFMSI